MSMLMKTEKCTEFDSGCADRSSKYQKGIEKFLIWSFLKANHVPAVYSEQGTVEMFKTRHHVQVI